ncbi:MAG: hypothetical protein RM049_30655 [Nostoc sp. DedQUE04]|uniref:hypothetical protein n=1 Tax=Nostoc sp. DedQUE04 TaxID=3075390 RepID=UPI002AD2B1F4|nr:hypothetical protein [Nostoc sp. DedQUE04]MDZ8139601.1 hypothetical protein [Nostoc sp. DedQUE04]
MIRLILLTATIAALIGMIFFALATVRLKNLNYGLLTFLWSFIFALLGSGIGFFLGWLWYKWTLKTDQSFSNPNLSGLSQGMMAGYLITVWLFCVQTGTILGGIWGGVCGLKYYQTRSKRT